MKAQTQSIGKDIVKSSKSWRTLTLGEVGEIVSGGTPSTAVSEYWGGEINWISPSDLTGYKKKTIKKGAKSITKVGLKNSSARLTPKGSVLFSSRAPIGYVVIAAEELCTNQGFKSIIPHDFISSEYLYYFLLASKQEAEKVASGTTFKEISKSKFSELTIPIPDLDTQHRIVEKIEELFSELDKGIGNLKLAQDQLHVYRQSVLKWAFEGRLTNEDVKEGELPEGWNQTSIKQFAEINPKLPNRESLSASFKVQFIPMKLVEEVINKIHLTEIREFGDVKKNSYTPFINGDIVFAKVTPCMENGKIAITNNLVNGIGFGSSEFHVIRCSPFIYNKFLFYYLVQDKFRKEAENAMTGAVGLRRVSRQFIENSVIPLPSKREQQKIIIEIEQRLSMANNIQDSINKSLQHVKTLRLSIMKKAFKGLLIN